MVLRPVCSLADYFFLGHRNKHESELTAAYADKKKSSHILNLGGIAFIAIGFLFCPMIVPAEMYVLDNIVLACGMVLAGTGAFLCVYMAGIVRAYRLLIMNEEYHEKRKAS